MERGPSSQSCVTCRDAFDHPPLHPSLVNNGAFTQLLCGDSEEWSIRKLQKYEDSRAVMLPLHFLGPVSFSSVLGHSPYKSTFWKDTLLTFECVFLHSVSLVGLALLGGVATAAGSGHAYDIANIRTAIFCEIQTSKPHGDNPVPFATPCAADEEEIRKGT